MLRAGPLLAVALLAGPVLFGLAATLVPAFGYFPALGGDEFGLDAFRQLAAEPTADRRRPIAIGASRQHRVPSGPFVFSASTCAGV